MIPKMCSRLWMATRNTPACFTMGKRSHGQPIRPRLTRISGAEIEERRLESCIDSERILSQRRRGAQRFAGKNSKNAETKHMHFSVQFFWLHLPLCVSLRLCGKGFPAYFMKSRRCFGKTLLITIILSTFAVAGHSETNTNAAPTLTWKFQAPVDGMYGPLSTAGCFAYENIEIEGNHFRYFITSDCLGGNPDYKGKIIQFNDHIWLDHRKMPSPDWVSGLLTNRPVLWTYEAFDHWKKTGQIDPMGILYRSEPLIARDPATNRNEMFRQVRATIQSSR